MSTNSVDEVTQYISKATVDNINPAAMEAKIKGKLMGIPVAAGARILAINNDITKAVPATMEELEADANKITKPPQGLRPVHARARPTPSSLTSLTTSTRRAATSSP